MRDLQDNLGHIFAGGEEGKQTMPWKLLVTESFSVDKLKKLNVEIVSIKKLSKRAELTEREERVLKIAYGLGYFEVPKKTGGRLQKVWEDRLPP